MDYTLSMIEILQSETFSRWVGKLKDRQAIARINARIRRLSETGNFGDVKPVREGVIELRIDSPDTGFTACSEARCWLC